MSSSSLSSPSESELRSRLSEMMAPVRTEPVGALVCPRGSALDVVYHEYREALDRLLTHIRSYDERVHGALQVDILEEYEERWRAYQTIAIDYADKSSVFLCEDSDYASELALRNTLISKRRDAIVIFLASFDKVAKENPDDWFARLADLIASAQKEWDEMVDMRHVYPEDDD